MRITTYINCCLLIAIDNASLEDVFISYYLSLIPATSYSVGISEKKWGHSQNRETNSSFPNPSASGAYTWSGKYRQNACSLGISKYLFKQRISILIAGSKFCDRNSSETAASLMLWLCMSISGGLKFCDS